MITRITCLSLCFLFLFSCKQEDDEMATADPCRDVVCLNGGTCSNGLCACESGYTGSQCENYEPCAEINCQNGGTCQDGTCDCPFGYGGSLCETQLTPTAVLLKKVMLTNPPPLWQFRLQRVKLICQWRS